MKKITVSILIGLFFFGNLDQANALINLGRIRKEGHKKVAIFGDTHVPSLDIEPTDPFAKKDGADSKFLLKKIESLSKEDDASGKRIAFVIESNPGTVERIRNEKKQYPSYHVESLRKIALFADDKKYSHGRIDFIAADARNPVASYTTAAFQNVLQNIVAEVSEMVGQPTTLQSLTDQERDKFFGPKSRLFGQNDKNKIADQLFSNVGSFTVKEYLDILVEARADQNLEAYARDFDEINEILNRYSKVPESNPSQFSNILSFKEPTSDPLWRILFEVFRKETVDYFIHFLILLQRVDNAIADAGFAKAVEKALVDHDLVIFYAGTSHAEVLDAYLDEKGYELDFEAGKSLQDLMGDYRELAPKAFPTSELTKLFNRIEKKSSSKQPMKLEL